MRPSLRSLLIYLAIWLVIVVVFTAQMQIRTEGEWQRSLVHSLAQWASWIILAPAVLWLTIRFPLPISQLDGRVRNTLIHMVMSVAIGMLTGVMFEKIFKVERRQTTTAASTQQEIGPRPGGPPRRQMQLEMELEAPGMRPPPPHRGSPDRMGNDRPGRRPPPPPEAGEQRNGAPNRPPRKGRPDRKPPLLVYATRQLQVGLPVYWAIVSIQSMLMFGQRLRRRERDALELQTKLTNAQLETLRLQLQPHFLFNAMNAVSTLVHSDPDKADEMIGHLSTLLRGALDEKNANEVTLNRELELLNAYINVERVRFGERILFEETIAPDCVGARLPPLLLQPLVENAVRHGLEPLGKAGRLWLNAEKRHQHLVIRIEDNGVGRQKQSGSKGWGIGLSNARARLQALYGCDGYSLELTDREGGGTVVHIELPFDDLSKS